MPFPANKTKLVCTIGPASDSPEMLEKIIMAGMNVARLNFSHGDFDSHRETIAKICELGKLPTSQSNYPLMTPLR
jgi:pyruvate kinase